MTEVRDTSTTGKALFATQNYAVGNILLHEEKPLAILPRSSLADNRFQAIVQACQSLDPDIEKQLLALYHPQQDTQQPAEQELWKQTQPASQNNETLHKIIMVAFCNSFEGGHVYKEASRINHSCQPNAIVRIQDNQNLQVQALIPIMTNDAVSISYAGLYLYADTRARQTILRRDKFFDCTCVRCQALVDPGNTIPCTVCHPRQQSQLDEATQYDDDTEQPVSYMSWHSNRFVCESCNHTETSKSSIVKVVHSISDKVLQFLEQYKHQQEQKKSQSAKTQEDKNIEEDDEEEEIESLLQEHLSLASSVLGSRHWTTNLLLLLYLDRGLKQFHQKLIIQQTTGVADDGEDEEEMQMELAEHIDHLQRITGFIERLQVDLHPGHLLSDVIIGVARALVSLGDVKSCKYAAEWLEHLNGYEPFLSESLLKVIDSLKHAWERIESEEPAQKKSKSSFEACE